MKILYKYLQIFKWPYMIIKQSHEDNCEMTNINIINLTSNTTNKFITKYYFGYYFLKYDYCSNTITKIEMIIAN